MITFGQKPAELPWVTKDAVKLGAAGGSTAVKLHEAVSPSQVKASTVKVICRLGNKSQTVTKLTLASAAVECICIPHERVQTPISSSQNFLFGSPSYCVETLKYASSGNKLSLVRGCDQCKSTHTEPSSLRTFCTRISAMQLHIEGCCRCQ